jgi:hypothetical protein
MGKGGRLQKFNDKVLVPWWSRYLVLPGLAAAPGTFAVFWFGEHTADQQFWLKGKGPAVILISAVWAGIVTAFKGYAEDRSKVRIDDVVRGRDDLVRLIGWVRRIVESKSRRFHDAQRDLQTNIDPATIFRTITRPDAQIKKIVEAIHGFFSHDVAADEERLKVSLMRWNTEKQHLYVYDWFPDASRPRSSPENFKDNRTIAGLAYFGKDTIVSEDVQKDPRYAKLADRDDGSMFAYPVCDDISGRTVFVVNLFSTKIGRFKSADKPKLSVPMEVFGERLALEFRLLEMIERLDGKS